MKGELTQCKLKLKKLYSSSKKLDKSMSIQRPTYDKTSLGYFFNMSTKKPRSKSNPKEKDKFYHDIESNKSSNKPKEVAKDKEVEILDEPKKVESPKETRYEFRGNFFSRNEIGHMKRDCTNK